MGPKSDKAEDEGVRYHARERMKQDGNSEWEFEEAPTTMLPSRMIMVRILIAKIESRKSLAQLLQQIPSDKGSRDGIVLPGSKKRSKNSRRRRTS